MSVYEKLLKVQGSLIAPKTQTNTYASYKYRSCEDILKAVKPLLTNNKASIVLNDEIVNIGNRYYIKATATFVDIETGETASNTAFAREEEVKRGMDGAQITGTASSYARKYALNGLLLIDDTKDADTDEYVKATMEKPTQDKKAEPVVANEDDYYVRVKSGELVSITTLNVEQLEYLLQHQTYADGWERIKKEIAKRG